MDQLSTEPPKRTYRLADGGLATTLQMHGLPPFTWINDWLREQPEQIAQVHRDFVAAGSQIVITGTFRTLPHLDPKWRTAALQALVCANQAGADEIWLSVGPLCTVEQTWSSRPTLERQQLTEGWTALIEVARPQIHGVLLESFTTAADAVAAVKVVRDGWAGPLVASLSPGPDGALFDGSPVGPALDQLLEVGADHVGLNCGSDASDVSAAAQNCGHRDLWIRPGSLHPSPDDLTKIRDLLGDRIAVLGGCCGYGPSDLRRLAQ